MSSPLYGLARVRLSDLDCGHERAVHDLSATGKARGFPSGLTNRMLLKPNYFISIIRLVSVKFPLVSL